MPTPAPRRPSHRYADPPRNDHGTHLRDTQGHHVRPLGQDGEGIPPHFPAIIDQPGAYIVAQFVAWQNGTRANDPSGLMKSVATRLDQDEIAAVAAWLASIAPMPVKPAAAKSR